MPALELKRVVPSDIKNGTFQITEHVTVIGMYSFENLEKLTTIKIPSTVRAIEMGAFSRCSLLKNVAMQNGLYHIRSDAFEACTSLEYLYVPASVKYIDVDAFKKCKNLNLFIGSKRSELNTTKAFVDIRSVKYGIPEKDFKKMMREVKKKNKEIVTENSDNNNTL